ncbi:uncharacterized protein N7500_009136 [Penicillium coprophilum]|uniref:uncharacterized protein n=1 Tax=Penicillium coprophilum TaxID=36646 RepID=UPI0023A2D8B5|nr:uncharacterized protein N7500_009136 [Penicillium coprophilum]KAJ5153697.1 hypothetical protein N7500_009136 [Penicillium coprophilum]
MSNQIPLRLPKWLQKLEGKSNWSSWRKDLQEAFVTVDPISWEVLMNRGDDNIKAEPGTARQEEPTTIEEAQTLSSFFAEHDDSSDNDSDLMVTITGSIHTNPPVLNRNNPVDLRKLNIRARDLLASGLGTEPLAEIDRVMDAHEAYVKLESLYGKTSAQSVHIAWEKFSRVRYSTRGLTPAAFVDRFQKSLRDVKDQCVEVPPTVELAQFQQAIKPNPNSTTFMADMKVDIYDPNFMDLVYEEFLKDQSPI